MCSQSWQAPVLAAAQSRPRVLAEINAALALPLVVLMAATGFGKTFAAHAVWESTESARAWWTVPAGSEPGEAQVEQLASAARCAWGLAGGDGPGIVPLLSDLDHAVGGLLVIDDLDVGQTPLVWAALIQLVPAMPAHCHILLLCRDTPPLPMTRWHTQRLAQVLYQSLLALDFDEWQQAGFGSDASAWTAALGWWGAESAAVTAFAYSPTDTPWNLHLERWISEVLLPSLSPQNRYLLGVCSLVPEMSFELVCAMADVIPSNACNAWAEFPTHSGPFRFVNNLLSVAERYRPYVRLAWQRENQQAWLLAVTRGSDYLLKHRRFADAAELCLKSGLAKLQERVLQVSGWVLLFSAHRQLLGELLKQHVLEPSRNTRLLQIAWQIEVERLPHSVDNEVADMANQLAGNERGAALALLAAIGWRYDDYERGELQARAALAAFEDDLHPCYAFATFTLGRILLVKGHIHLADPVLQLANACAARDGLTQMQLEIQHQRALLASEAGDYALARALLLEVLADAGETAMELRPIIASARQMLAWTGLEQLDIAAGAVAEQAGDTDDCRLDDDGNFPRHWFDGVSAMLGNDLASTQQAVDLIAIDMVRGGMPSQWQNDASLLQLWLAATTFDQEQLHKLAAQLSQCQWKADRHRDRRMVLLAAARLLASVDDDMPTLTALHGRLLAQGASALAHQLGVIIALSSNPGDLMTLLDHVRESAVNDQAFDYIWLGSKTVGPLKRLLSAVELATDTATLHFLRRILQQAVHAPNKMHSSLDRAPPSGLTKKEWKVLQLIAQGHTNEQIASGLFVSLATVKTHINHLYSKLNIQSRTEAMDAARLL